MKRIILLIFILVLYSAYSSAQDTCRLNYRITTIPFQYLFNDYNLTFEKAVSNRRTTGLKLRRYFAFKAGQTISIRLIINSFTK